ASVEVVDTELGGPTSDPQRLKRCREMLSAHAIPQRGHIFTAENGRLDATFPDTKVAIKASAAFCEAITEHNYHQDRESQLTVRVGLHQGPVITDGQLVTGRQVAVSGHITQAARNGEILLSEDALRAAPKLTQALCTAVESIESDELSKPLQLYAFSWRNTSRLPTAVLVEDSGEEIALPEQDLISFGRLDKLPNGAAANDIVLTHTDDKVQRAISRLHFELRRVKAGYVLRSISRLGTQVDDKTVEAGKEVPVTVGSVICVAQRLRLVLKGKPEAESQRQAATMTVGVPA
ncbi:MAG: FHA domain-containing protein, partial [Myxococcota bacterium]